MKILSEVDVISIGLLILVILLGGLLVYVLTILKGIQSHNAIQRTTLDDIKMQNAVQKEAIDNLDTDVKPEVITAGIAGSGEVLKGAVLNSLKEINFTRDIEGIRSSAQRIGEDVADINKIFLDKQEAAGWAEIELEARLKDSFSKVHIRKRVAKLANIPDAHLELNGGRLLCIDSKFPIKSFKAMIPESKGGDGVEDGRSRISSRAEFIKAMTIHFDKVAGDYVRPELGTIEVAYLYVASERIYHHMVNPDNTEESNLVRDAASKGVILCSPATIIANMHLVRVAEHAMGIAEKTDQILIGHDGMRRAIAELAKAWSTMSSHVNNAQSKRSEVQALMEEVERAMKNLENLDLGDDD